MALHPRWADLSAVTGVEDLGRALREQAVREPDAEWVRGFGWEQAGDWSQKLGRSDLDALGLDRPVIVTPDSSGAWRDWAVWPSSSPDSCRWCAAGVLDGDLDPDHPPTVAETWVAGRRRHPDV